MSSPGGSPVPEWDDTEYNAGPQPITNLGGNDLRPYGRPMCGGCGNEEDGETLTIVKKPR